MNLKSNVSRDKFVLTHEEQKSYETLKHRSPEWANMFLHMFLSGRDKITARLMGSLYRENLVGSYQHSQIVPSHHLKHSPFKDSEVLCTRFPSQNLTILASITGKHAFNRIDVQGPFYWLKENAYIRVQHPNELLTAILTEDPSLKGPHSRQFEDDLENSATHMTLTLSYQALQHQQNSMSLLHYLEEQTDAYLTSEQSVVEGHPIHPGAKLRKGMTTEQTIAYASEYGNEIDLQFVLVHHSLTRKQSLGNSYNAIVFQMFTGLKEAIIEQLPSSISLSDYDVMIIHPWQYSEVLTKAYSDELSTQHIIPISYSAPYFAGLSFRTLMPKFPDMSPHIKLSTNVHITGEIRTLSEQTTHNGPLMTEILQSIEMNDSWFKALNTKSVPEWAGIHFYNEDDEAAIQEQRSEQLGTLYRENIYHYVTEKELPLIPSSLVVTSTQSERPLLVELIQRYQHHQSQAERTSILEWFEHYATSLIDYVIPLLVKYGIALEAHLQNTIAIIDSDTGALSKMLIRDFEGLRIDEKQLNLSGYDTHPFHEKSRILTDSDTTVFNKAFYSTIQNHLGELVACIAKYYQDATLENDLWHIVRHHIHDLMTQFKTSHLNASRIQKIEALFFNPQIDYKCVTTMRLLDEAHAYTYVKVDNPLKK